MCRCRCGCRRRQYVFTLQQLAVLVCRLDQLGTLCRTLRFPRAPPHAHVHGKHNPHTRTRQFTGRQANGGSSNHTASNPQPLPPQPYPQASHTCTPTRSTAAAPPADQTMRRLPRSLRRLWSYWPLSVRSCASAAPWRFGTSNRKAPRPDQPQRTVDGSMSSETKHAQNNHAGAAWLGAG